MSDTDVIIIIASIVGGIALLCVIAFVIYQFRGQITGQSRVDLTSQGISATRDVGVKEADRYKGTNITNLVEGGSRALPVIGMR